MTYVCLCGYQSDRLSNIQNHLAKKYKCRELTKEDEYDILQKCMYCECKFNKQNGDKKSHHNICLKKREIDTINCVQESLRLGLNNITYNDNRQNIVVINMSDFTDVKTLIKNLQNHLSSDGCKFLDLRDDTIVPTKFKRQDFSGLKCAFFDRIYFNEEVPENHSIIKSDKELYIIKGDLVEITEDDLLNFLDSDEFDTEFINYCYQFIEDHSNDFTDKYKESFYEYFDQRNNIFSKKHTIDKENDKIKKFLNIFGNRDIPKNIKIPLKLKKRMESI